MAEFVDYKEVPLGDKNYWEVDRDIVRGGVGNAICWNIEYKPVWDVEEKIVGLKPKAAVYARGGRAEVVIADVGVNYAIKADKDGNVYIDYLKPVEIKPVEKRGLYDSCIDNHMDIPESISKDSPCYKQFMKEFEGK